MEYELSNFCWGTIIRAHEIGDFTIVEYYHPENTDKILFHVYIKGKDTNRAYSSLDHALIAAVVYKATGNDDAAYYIYKIIDLYYL